VKCGTVYHDSIAPLPRGGGKFTMSLSLNIKVFNNRTSDILSYIIFSIIVSSRSKRSNNDAIQERVMENQCEKADYFGIYIEFYFTKY
jgi:hypothetical protein